MSDVPKIIISPATYIPQKDCWYHLKRKRWSKLWKELDSHHCWGSSCSMPYPRVPRNVFFFTLLKYLVAKTQFLKIFPTV